MRIAAEGGKNAAMPAKKNTAETVRALIEETVASLGYDLWDVTYEKEGRDYNLVVSIDRASGVSIDDCKVVSDAVEPLLDEADPIEGPYCLEVSSAGVSRLLRTDAHLQYAAERGLPVTASAYTPVFAGAKQYTGRIESFDAQTIRFADGPAVERKAVARLEAEC